MQTLGPAFWELMVTPFRHTELIWGIVPLYFGWILNEVTSAKASYRTAIQTGFSFLWAGAHWTSQYFRTHPDAAQSFNLELVLAVNVTVTAIVLLLGLAALASGLRRKYPRHGSFLGHTRFSNYFMIALFPLQSGYLAWSWERFLAILVFTVPVWLLCDLGLSPLRK